MATSLPESRERVVVVGAGLVGTLAAISCARRGHRVDVYERNPDLRRRTPPSSGSINLTLCVRAFEALARVGGAEAVRSLAVPILGRRIHWPDQTTTFEPYGTRGEAIWSITRHALNTWLLDLAETQPSVRLHFEHRCEGLELGAGVLHVVDPQGHRRRRPFARLIAADGAHSSIRRLLEREGAVVVEHQRSDQAYREIRLPAEVCAPWWEGPGAIHVWPRGDHMLLGFPNLDRSFTGALYLPVSGPGSHETLYDLGALRRLFARSFPDVVDDVLTHAERIVHDRPRRMDSVRCRPWSVGGRVLLLGDAAHAMYPLYGQGANAGFQDCAMLDEELERAHGHPDPWTTAMTELERRRREHTDVISQLSIAHFQLLSNELSEPEQLLRQWLERELNRLYPDRFAPLYNLVAFTSLPYGEALQVAARQQGVVDTLMREPALRARWGSPRLVEQIERLVASLPPLPAVTCER